MMGCMFSFFLEIKRLYCCFVASTIINSLYAVLCFALLCFALLYSLLNNAILERPLTFKSNTRNANERTYQSKDRKINQEKKMVEKKNTNFIPFKKSSQTLLIYIYAFPGFSSVSICQTT